MKNHLPSLSQSLCDPLSTVYLLHYREHLLRKEVVTKVHSSPISDQCDILLTAVTESVQTDPNNLQTFARVLCKVSTNKQLGLAIQKDIGKYVNFDNNLFAFLDKYFPHLQLDIEPQGKYLVVIR